MALDLRSCGGIQTSWTIGNTSGADATQLIMTNDAHHDYLHRELDEARREVNALKDLYHNSRRAGWWTRRRLRRYLRTR